MAPYAFSAWKVKAAQNKAGWKYEWKIAVKNSSKTGFGGGALLWFFPSTAAIKLEYIIPDSETIRKLDDS